MKKKYKKLKDWQIKDNNLLALAIKIEINKKWN